MNGRPDNLVKWLYYELKPDDEDVHYKRCYKCPAEITEPHILQYYAKYWPRTKLFVGVRHPIPWFESLYNFRVETNETMPHPTKLIGRCRRHMHHTCTEKANFAYHLLRLGKQQHWKQRSDSGGMTMPRTPTPLEERIVSRYKPSMYNLTAVPYLPNPVFLFDTGQIGDTNASRRATFRHDVQRFLKLDEDLPDMPHVRPGRDQRPSHVQRQIDEGKIRICDAEYEPVRRELLRLAQQNSEWIRGTFLDLPTVHVSSRPYLEALLETWVRDPCETENYNSDGAKNDGGEILQLPAIKVAGVD